MPTTLELLMNRATQPPPTTAAEYRKRVMQLRFDPKAVQELQRSIPYDPMRPWLRDAIIGKPPNSGVLAAKFAMLKNPDGFSPYNFASGLDDQAVQNYLMNNIANVRDANGNPVSSISPGNQYYITNRSYKDIPFNRNKKQSSGGLFGVVDKFLESAGPLLPLAIASGGILSGAGSGSAATGATSAGAGAAGASGATGLASLGSSVLPAAEAFGAGVSPGLLAPGVASMGSGLGAGVVGAGTLGSGALGSGAAAGAGSSGGGFLSGVGDFLQDPISSISNLFSGASPGGAMSTAQLNEAANIYKAAGYSDAEIAGFLSQASGASLADVGAALNGTSSALNFANGAAGAGTGLFGSGITGGQLLSGGLSLAGGLLSGNAAANAARTSADAQIRAAQIAADAAKFKPVGVSTNFGSSRFGYDQNGNLINAGYSLSPQLQAQQNTLMGASNPLLSQFTGSQAATAPMGQAAQSLFGLGNQYLQTTPEQQAAKFMQEQQALLAAPRANQLADIQARLNAQGRGGLSIGGNAGQMAANPELAAYYNALQQQDLGLAANATQGGMDYAKFGGGLVGLGGDMLNSMYGVQSNAYQPYATALGGAAKIEGLGQQALDTGINIGAKGTASNALSGQLMMNGLNNAAATMQDVNKISPWGTVLTSAGGMLNNYMNPQQQRFDPYTGQPVTQFGR